MLEIVKKLFLWFSKDKPYVHKWHEAPYKPHVHKWQEVPWDPALGKNFEPKFKGSMCATYRTLYKCSCGETRIESEGGLI